MMLHAASMDATGARDQDGSRSPGPDIMSDLSPNPESIILRSTEPRSDNPSKADHAGAQE